MRPEETHFTLDDIRRHVEAVQNDIAKKEHRIELVDPMLIGACVGCGTPLVDAMNNPYHMCPKCQDEVGRAQLQLQKKKLEAKRKGKKMSNKMVVHIDQIKVLGT